MRICRIGDLSMLFGRSYFHIFSMELVRTAANRLFVFLDLNQETMWWRVDAGGTGSLLVRIVGFVLLCLQQVAILSLFCRDEQAQFYDFVRSRTTTLRGYRSYLSPCGAR